MSERSDWSTSGQVKGALGLILLVLAWPAHMQAYGRQIASPTHMQAASSTSKHCPLNIILVSIDTLRADHLGCYGYARSTSPFIDSLARRGVRFNKAFANASWTLPSHVSLMTSRYPHAHGVERPDEALPPTAMTLAEVLRDGGYHTAGFISWVYVSAQYGFDQGFDLYRELLPPEGGIDDTTHLAVKASDFVDQVLAEWSPPSDAPFFLFLHLFDPHINYEPPEPYDRMFMADISSQIDGSFGSLRPFIKGMNDRPGRIDADGLRKATALYDGEIRYVDDQLARLFGQFERRGLLDHTIIVLTSDHGEELDDHGSMEGHQWTLYDEVLHVPLIVCLPRDPRAGEVVEEVVQLIDVAPTLLSAVGLPVPKPFQGRDRTPAMRGQRSDPQSNLVFAEIKRFNRKWMVRNDRLKLIYTDEPRPGDRDLHAQRGYELYDLTADPRETRNLAGRWTPMAVALRSALRRWASAGTVESAPTVEKASLTDRQVARLRGMGYLEATRD